MKRMHDIIHKAILEIYNNLEEVPHRVVQSAAISHFVYGSDDSNFRKYADDITKLRAFISKDNKYWTDLLQKYLFLFHCANCRYLLDTPYAVIEGRPSNRLGEQLLQDELSRVESQVITFS